MPELATFTWVANSAKVIMLPALAGGTTKGHEFTRMEPGTERGQGWFHADVR